MNEKELQKFTDNLDEKILSGQEIVWEDIRYALSLITPEKDAGLYGRVCYYAAYYMLGNGRQEECLCYLNEGIRYIIGTEQEVHLARCYNMLGVVCHSQNNLVVAMENYGKALKYAAQYDQLFIHSLVLGNMADAYQRVESYAQAVVCYKKCIKEMRESGDRSVNGENVYYKVLACYGYCLVMTGDEEEAIPVARELGAYSKENITDAAAKLAAYNLFALLSYKKGFLEEADRYMRKAVRIAQNGCTISSDFDNILNLLQYVILVKNTDCLRELLDYLEPQAAIERNEGFLLQLLLFRLRYCSDDMEQESFVENTNTFFRLKNKYENTENGQVLRMMSLRSRLRKIEEEQGNLKKKNSRLVYQTEHDELSGLYNKRHLNRHMEEMFEEALHKGLPLGVVFTDIDYFKQMNDHYGHQKGDSCIVAIAEVIRECMPEDFAARYGGDEFVILTLGRSKEYLEERAKMLVDKVRERQIPNVDSEQTDIVTITVGAVCAVPHKPNKMWDFLTAADETLYEQKKEKKGCVRFYVGKDDGL